MVIGYFLRLVLGFMILTCSSNKQKLEAPGGLLESEALSRSQQLSQVNYDLEFWFSENGASYEGFAKISFNRPKGNESTLSIDLEGAQIQNILINNKVSRYSYNGKKIQIATDKLADGPNTIAIRYNQHFDSTGRGLTRFVDPKDKAVYLYTNQGPYNTHYVFPCFDQPNILAAYKMKVTVPLSWKVISYSREEQISKAPNGKRTWIFPQSQKFSTHLWTLYTGNFHLFERPSYSIKSQRLYVRESLKEQIDPSFWFKTLHSGLNFYRNYFETSFPFNKFDHIFLPQEDPLIGAGVGISTISEKHLVSASSSKQKKLEAASIVLSQLAQIWLDIILPVDWWNNYWQNKSLSIFLSYLALPELSDFSQTESSQVFFLSKQGSVATDYSLATRPLSNPYPTTYRLNLSYNNLSFIKGAFLFKQLHSQISPLKFQKTLQSFIRKKDTHANLLEALNRSTTPQSTQNWTLKWVQESGINEIYVDYKCNNLKRISSFIIHQKKSNFGNTTIKPQKLEIGLYYLKQGKMNRSHILTAYSRHAQNAVNSAIGLQCPDFVDPNHNDLAYALVRLDPISLQSFMENEETFHSPFLKQRIWNSLLYELIQGSTRLGELSKLLLSSLKHETDPFVLYAIKTLTLGTHSTTPSLYFYWPKQSAINLNLYFVFAEQIEKILWNRLGSASPGSELQIALFDFFHKATVVPFGLSRIKLILDRKVLIKGLQLTSLNRWDLIMALARAGDNEAISKGSIELKQNNTTLSLSRLLSTRANFGDPEFIEKWRKRFIKNSYKGNPNDFKNIWKNLYPVLQESNRDANSDVFFTDLKKSIDTLPMQTLLDYLQSGPTGCLETDRKRYLELSEALDSPDLQRALKASALRGLRCQRVRSLF